MAFRWKLLFAFAATTVVAVAVVALVATHMVSTAFVRNDQVRIEQVLSQAQNRVQQRGEEAMRRVAAVSEDDAMMRIAIGLGRSNESVLAGGAPVDTPAPRTFGAFVDEAATLAREHELELLQIVGDDGVVLSSAQWEARAGEREADVPLLATKSMPFIRLEDTPAGRVLAIEAVRDVNLGDRKFYLLGGYALDESFAAELGRGGIEDIVLFRADPGGSLVPVVESAHPAATPSTRHRRGAAAPAASGAPEPPSGVIEELRRAGERAVASRALYRGEGTGPLAATRSTVAAMPLTDVNGAALGALVFTVSGVARLEVIRSLYWAAIIAGGLGLVVALLLSILLAHRITAPVGKLVRASEQLARGNLAHRTQMRGDGELERLGAAFNDMAARLDDSRARLLQAERVAGWRELARRLAHELKNPLFPLQLSVENLRRSRTLNADEFSEAFDEATAALAAGVDQLKTSVARFSDFARMPQPQRRPVAVRELLESIARVYEPQMRRQNVELAVQAGEGLVAPVDPQLMANALGNLVQNALEVMPGGGRLELRAWRDGDQVAIEVGDTGPGLTAEQRARLFTPYFTTKKNGTGLGLAIVQSVVADHQGRVSFESDGQRGARFRIDLPLQPPADGAKRATS